MSNVDIYPFQYIVRWKPPIEVNSESDFLSLINSIIGKNRFLSITPEFLKQLTIENNALTRKSLSVAIGKRGKSNRSIGFYTFMGYSIEDSKQLIKELQITSTRKKKTYPNNYDISFIMKKHNVTFEEANKMREERIDSAPLPSMASYWIKRGFSEIESIEKVADHNRFANLKLSEKDELDPSRKIGRTTTQLDYYISRGYGQEEAEELLLERQKTFTLEKCIEKHGIEEGTKIWRERQDKWLATLDSKSDEEKAEINRKKGIDRHGNPHFGANPIKIKSTHKRPCMLYYVKITDLDNKDTYWKIGITFQTLKQRFSELSSSKRMKYELIYSIVDNVVPIFDTEQKILRNFKEDRVIIDKNGFRTTEGFSRDIFGTQENFQAYFDENSINGNK